MSPQSTEDPHVFPKGRKPGEMLFSILLLIIAAALLATLPWQTTWVAGKGLAAQPRFWPALSLGGVILFAILHKLMRRRIDRTPGRWAEGLTWIRSLEFIGWYMIYVAAIPVIGYLFATLAFCTLLTLRVGYRGNAVIWATIFGLSVVLIFKSAMNVKIPGGAIYEYAPEGLRYILLRYF
jgi:hypothetical protein